MDKNNTCKNKVSLKKIFYDDNKLKIKKDNLSDPKIL